MFVVDTNVLVYAADRASPLHPPCRARLEAWRHQATPWYLPWTVVYEFLRVVTHPKVLHQPWSVGEAWRMIEALLASPSLTLLAETDRHTEVLSEILAEAPRLRGNILHDAHIAAVMREHGIHTIYTCDADFNRFRFLEVLDPTA